MLASLLAGGLTAQETKSTQNTLIDQIPLVSQPLPNFEATESAPDTTIDLSKHFSDPDNPGAALSYSITHISKPNVAGVTVSNHQMTIDYLTPGQTNVIIAAEYNGQSTIHTFIIGVRPDIPGYFDIATFDGLPLDPESYWNGSDEYSSSNFGSNGSSSKSSNDSASSDSNPAEGSSSKNSNSGESNDSDGSGGFTSGTLHFYNNYNPDWNSWYSWAYSNTTDNTTPGWTNPYSAFSPVRLDSAYGQNYGVTYTSPLSQITTQKNADQLFHGFFVTNNTYAALSMKEGDGFTKKFGGSDGSDPDWFKLTVTGTDSNGNKSTVDYYLADYRFENPNDDYIIETWQWVDLTPLGKVNTLTFSLSSTDNGDWGMNTPSYFCMDNLHTLPDPPDNPYIAEVLEYTPAPSQSTNAAPWGTPSSPESLIGGINGSVSLGAFGGSIIFRFDQPVRNHPDNPYGVDFTLFGNPMTNWSEPGIVSVMNDQNGNGLPDDTWYELAGSDHPFSTTDRNYSVTYTNPQTELAADVPWSDSQGTAGFIRANSYFTQPYYPLADSFPAIDQEQYTLSGTMIRSTIDTAFESTIYSLRRAFGYADNQYRGTAPFTCPDNPYTQEVENAGGDAFDISWAVDAEGNYVELDKVHFVKVHTGVMDGAGWLGQISTEITGAAMALPDASLTGSKELIVIREVPPLLTTTEYQLEAFAFRQGRLLRDEQVRWSASQPQAYVDETGLLHLEGSAGELTLTAAMATNEEVYASVTTTVELAVSVNDRLTRQTYRDGAAGKITLYPNPAKDFITLEGIPVSAPETGTNKGAGTGLINKSNAYEIAVYNLSGKQQLRTSNFSGSGPLDISVLSSGIYLLEVQTAQGTFREKFVKQ
jgi:hypothetical protein